ncbi:MAG: inositol-3-phosphate synthase [Candidatus Omnitrophica bacterium]|nr:inositol-3-phosphate synthase [Candidatus Omnitrophota bacterium]
MSLFEKGTDIKPAKGKLGVLIPGLGAVATTFIAGIEAVKRGMGEPIGSLTQLGTVRLGKRTDNRIEKLSDFLPLADLSDLVYAAWDPIPDDGYKSAVKAGVLERALIEQLRPELEKIKPWPAVFSQKYVKRLEGTNVKKSKSKVEQVEELKQDILNFKKSQNLDRLVMVWCASTEAYQERLPVHDTIDAFRKGLERNDDAVTPSMLYAYAAIQCGVPFANGAPNLTVDIPALTQFAKDQGVPVCGKDFKSGQTFMKTVIAPALKARMLGLDGWFSTNILGNRDGEVLDDPESFKTKEESKLSVLDYILQPKLYPMLYNGYSHKVRINYYRPRGDNKESWDNIDIKGWLGYPMQLKINFLCRDSILAAPIVLDLVLFLDLAQRTGMRGIQEWLSFYFKSPMSAPEVYPEHDLFIQLMKLKNTLRHLKGEELITHLGVEYYD